MALRASAAADWAASDARSLSSVDATLADHTNAINSGWLITMSFNVLVMQAGFTALEIGTSSAASAAAIVMKNLADMAVTSVCFWVLGWALAFGLNADGTANPFCGEGGFLLIGDRRFITFLFQYGFVATATTIVSGAVVGRIRFKHYILLAVTMSSLVYPIVAHAAWSRFGFLRELGFTDFAGVCVVHVTGGAVGLYATLWLGPRPGVFKDNGEYVPQRSSPTQALMGTICLWYSWFSFTAGSSTTLTNGGSLLAARSAAVTLLGSGAGFLVAMVWSWARSRGQHIDVYDSATGLLAGLVAVTGVCASIEPWEGFIIGALGAAAALGTALLLERNRIDDSVGVVPVHLGAGVAGTLLVGFFANDPSSTPDEPMPQKVPGIFHGGDGSLLGVQALGLLLVIVWTAVCFFVLAFLGEPCLGGLRVPEEDRAELDGKEVATDRRPPQRTRGLASRIAPSSAAEPRASRTSEPTAPESRRSARRKAKRTAWAEPASSADLKAVAVPGR